MSEQEVYFDKFGGHMVQLIKRMNSERLQIPYWYCSVICSEFNWVVGDKIFREDSELREVDLGEYA